MNFLSIQGSYNNLEIALFLNNVCVDQIKEDNKKASSILIPLIQKLLDKHSLLLSEINFIAIDQGPGAFTSLRVAITTVNAISFATSIPLVGVDGLDALATQNVVVILNAYNQDVYYKINDEKGCQNIDLLLSRFNKDKNTTFTGNATDLYLEKLSNFKIIHQKEATAETIGLMGLELYKKGIKFKKLLPLYLKTQNFKKTAP